MKKLILTQILCLFMFSIAFGQKNSIENNLYKISIPDDFNKTPSFAITHKASKITRTIRPTLRICFSETTPNLTGASVDNYDGIIAWKKNNQVQLDILKLQGLTLTAERADIKGGNVVFNFKNSEFGTVSLQVVLPQKDEAPQFVMHLQAKRKGWYSLGFVGLPETDPKKLDFLYQPLTWSWKRFPSASCLTEEAFCNTAATFVNVDGFTEGIAPAPQMIPYRYALSANWSNKQSNKIGQGFAYTKSKGNSLFGLGVRNSQGMAQPVLFAPLLGGEKSFMQAGQQYSFTCNYLLAPGDWMAGTEFLMRNVVKYKNERQNGTCTLNQTLENMIAFGMNDRLCGWKDEYKAFDYRFDAPGTVKMVSALHALGIAFTTGNMDIYQRRALPLTEYELSRQKFLFSIDTTQYSQNPSHNMKGPACEIGELAGLHTMSGGATSAFATEANRIFGKSRQLNLQTETGGASWQDYMARFRISNNNADLQKAEQGANEYIEKYVKNMPADFKSSAGLKDVQASFQIDFSTNIFDLFELYELTSKKEYLEAAHTGARHLLLMARSNPMAPDSLITVNQGDSIEGIFVGRREGTKSHEFVPRNTTTHLAEQQIPAWRTSLVGLVPEGVGTYTWGPIMLSHHAAWFLRIAALTGDMLLAEAAYNAVLGRYANFPGYYFTSLHTNVYQLPNYPMCDYYDIKYNSIFYNHIWPHIALLNDFLISDAYYRSGTKINFPSVYAPGYAYLTSKVYGASSGTIFGNPNIRLWMPSGAFSNCNTAINHLLGVSDNAFYVVLMNTTTKQETSDIQLNQDIVPYNSNVRFKAIVYNAKGEAHASEVVNGQLSETIPANSLIAIKIEGLKVHVPMFEKLQTKTNAITKAFVRETNPNDNIGTITGMKLSFLPDFSDAYIYSDVLDTKVRKATLKYQIANGSWTETTDDIYPFEFSIHLQNPNDTLRFKWLSESTDGTSAESAEMVLGN